MLFHKSPTDPTGAIDLYPHANDEQSAALQNRLTIMHGKIYYNGNEWTAEHIQREKERIEQLEATFKAALMVVEAEESCPDCVEEITEKWLERSASMADAMPSHVEL